MFGVNKGHFRANIEILPLGPSTRDKPAFNGIRWAFVHDDALKKFGEQKAPQSDVWPEFLTSSGTSLPTSTPLEGNLTAIMHIIFPHMIEYHMKRLKIGTQFHCMEGFNRVAFGEVTSFDI